MGWETAATVITNALLFFLVMGMASTVDIRSMKAQLRNIKAVSIGLFCQFIVLPFLGYIVVMIFSLPPTSGITLMIVVSSPGGSYSNWWCSILNADLALSVSMTTASTILSVGFLPLNLIIYSQALYGHDENSSGESLLESINFNAIFISLGVVIAAIGTGIFCSWKFDTPRWHKIAYLGGNISGISLIIFSTILSFVGGSDGSQPTTSEVTSSMTHGIQYFAICMPCLLGLVISTCLATFAKLSRPERLTTAVECCYQNTGIATSAALSLFSGEDLKEAMRVPLIYGFFEAGSICIYLLSFWKLGWSKAPKDEKFCTVITESYELRDKEQEIGDETNEIECLQDQELGADNISEENEANNDEAGKNVSVDEWIEDEGTDASDRVVGGASQPVISSS